MPLDKGKLQKLYSTLQKGGYSQSYAEFEKGFTGNDNYPNRKKVYDLLTEHGANIGNSYEDFMGKMQAPSKPSQPQQQNTPAPAEPAPKPQLAPKPKPRGGGMTAAERAQFIRNAQGIVHQSAAGLQRVKNQMDYANSNRGLKVKPVHLGQNPKVVKRNADGALAEQRPVLDMAPQDQPGQTYVTESGNEYDNRADADIEQNAIDQYNYDNSLDGQLNNAYAERDRLDEALKKRRTELEDKPWWRKTLEELGKASHSGLDPNATANDPEHQGYENDEEYMQLMSAARKNHQTIQTLEDKKNGKMNNFWHTFGTRATNGYTFADGLPELRDATALEYAKKYIKVINEKQQKGLPLTRQEQAAEAVLRANETDDAVQSLYGNDYGAWSRAGGMMANSVDFMKDFLLMPGGASMAKGIASKVAGIGGKALAKTAGESALKAMPKAIARATLKATGVLLGAHTAGAAISNTTGLGRTAALMGQKAAGSVTRDENGNYKVENEQSLMHALASAEREQARENGSEMFGEFLPGGKLLGGLAKKGLEKIGLSKVSNFLTQMGNKEWYKRYGQFLKTGGYNGIPGEAFEEYEGELFDALTGHAGDAWKDFTDAKQNTDIWLGCATMGALMGAIPMGIHVGGYYKFRHDMNKADKIASFRISKDKWEPLKEELDNTDNGNMADVVTKRIVMNDDLDPQEKKAALDYVRGLTNFRGFNIAQASNAGDEESQASQAQNDAYSSGYNTTDAASMNDAKNVVTLAQQKLDAIFGEHTDAQQILNAKNEDGTPYFTANDRKVAQEAVNAQQQYEGMLQRVRDDIDDEVQQTGAIYDSRTNDQGVIQSATLKAQNPDGTDKKVYITSGNVVMTDDGKSVDNQKSDMSIVVVDEDGKVQMISPDKLFSMDAPIDGAQAKQQAIDAIQQSKAQEAADKINGKVNLTAGNTYTLTDSTGQQIEATIVSDGQTGAIQNPDGTVNVSMNGKVVPMDVNTLQQMVDNTNMQRTAQGDEEDTAEAAAALRQPTEPDNTEQMGDGETVTPEVGTVVSDDEGSGAVPTYPGNVVAPDMSEPHQWQVDDTFTIDNGGVPVRGQVAGVGEDGVKIYTESPVNGKKMQVVTPEELQDMTTEINGEAVQAQPEEAAAMQQPTQPVDVAQAQEQTGNNGEENIQNGGEYGGDTEQNKPQRAIDRIPSQQVDDSKGNVRTVHNWEQAEPGDTYDALTEIYHGNADRVKKGIDNRVGKIDKAIKGVQKLMDSIDNSDDFDEVAAQSEQYDQLQQQKDELEKQKKYWQGVQMVPRNRKMDADRRTAEEAAAAKAAQEKAEAEAAEKARQEREQVNGVPDVINDVPADARKRGFRNVNGMVVNRQGNTEGVTGRESNVKFSSTDTAKGHIKVIDADQLQPSHVSGQRNPTFFIDEAQPKDRTDTVSGMAAAKIAADLNPEEITGDGSAYQFSAPTVNSRGEVIQGNNRSDALKLMYSNPAFKPAQDSYKQYIADHAEEFGFTPEDVAKIKQMEHPVMVNELDVPDDEAIRLGQMRASDNESGGIERIDPVTTSQKLGGKVSNFANVLLSSPDEDASLSDVLMQNGAKAVKWLRTQGAISDTAAQSAFDKKGNLTPEARMDLQNILKQSLFQGGVSDLPTMFDKMPAKAQKAILSTFMRDFDSAESERILPEIQRAIEAWYDCAMSNEAFAKASNYKAAKAAMHDWTLQTNLLDDNMPSDKFSNFARELACRLQGCSMRETQQSLNDFFDLVQGKSQGDLFGGTTMGEQTDRQEAIRRVFNIEYKPISNKNNGKTRSNVVADNGSQSGEGRQGSPTDGKGRERAESGSGSANGAGGTESDNEKVSLLDVVRALYNKGKEFAAKLYQRTFFYVADTPQFMKDLGLRGDKFTIKYGVISRHVGKDGSHDLTEEEWEQLPQSLQNPFAISRLSNKKDGYRLYTTLKNGNGEYIVVGADVKNGGRNIEVNAISTVFGRRQDANLTVNEEIVYRSKNITPDQSALLDRPNSDQYPTEGELFSAAKLGNSSESGDNKSEKVAEGEGINKGAVRTADGGYSKLPTNYAYRKTDAQELQDVLDNGMFRKMPDDKIVPGSVKTYTSRSGRKFTFGKQGGNSHGGKAFAAGMPWGDNGNGGTTSGGFTGESYYIAIPGNNVDGWRVGHHGHYSEPQPFDEIEAGKGLWLPFDEDGEVDLSTKGMRVFRKVGDTYYEVEHPEELFKERPIGSTSASEKVETERQGVNTEPSEKQKEAGNYKKGHIKVDGYDITIENPKGSVREKKDANGKVLWRTPMHYDYGYILGTKGTDGDHIDVYLSDNPTSGNVYVVDQIDQNTGKFDEHKVMYGFPSKEAAVEAYKGQYEKGWKVGTVTEVSREDFKKWVESSKRKTKPFSEYKSVKEAAAEQQPTGPALKTVDDVLDEAERRKQFSTDKQGNPVDGDGRLIKEKVSSLSDIKDEDFSHPSRTVELPSLPKNVDSAIGANGKPVIIKKNIFEKNAKAHQFTPAESRRILKEALYNPDLVGQTQPKKRPNHWVAIKVDEESPITVLEVNENKYNVEIVGWYRLDDRNLGRIKRQAEREGGELLILTPKGAAASLSTLPLNSSSVGKDSKSSDRMQGKSEKVEPSVEELLELSDALDRANKIVEEGILSGIRSEDNKEAWNAFFQAKRALTRAALRLSEKRLSDLVDGRHHEEWYDHLSDVSREVFRKVDSWNKKRSEYARDFEAILSSQPTIAPSDPPKRVSVMDFVNKDKSDNSNPTYGNVYHDGGYVVGTDGHVLFAQHTSYPKELEGKTTDRKGNVTGSYYPKWRSIVPNLDGSEALDVNIGALHRFVRGVLKYDKNKDVSVVVRDGAGHLSVYRANGLDLFLRAAELCNTDIRLTPLDYGESGYLLAFSNENGIALMMPLATGDLRDMESLYAFDGSHGVDESQDKHDEQAGYDWGFHRSPSRAEKLTKREAALRDGLSELMRDAGIEVIDDEKEGQRVLDMANGAQLSRNKKRALETALLWDKSHFKGTVVSSADGAKILNKIDTLAKEYENEERNTRNFISDAGKALNAKRKEGSTSQYATFETKNGNIVTIRIADHNAKVENFDHNNQENAISIVISRRGNNGLTKNGESHVIEFYYSDKELNKLGKDGFVQILKGIKQALYSGEFKDTTGLAERQEVNAGDLARLQKVYHGSGNDFDMFQTMRHLGEGEGNQAFGLGTYVADQMDLAKKYAYIGFERQRHRVTEGTLDGKPINWNHPDTPGYVFVAFDKVSKYGKEEALKSLKQNIVDYESLSKLNPDNKSWQEHLEESKKAYDLVSGSRMTIKLPDGNHAPILYTVNIPDDNGKNYLDWDGWLSRKQADTIRERLYKAILALNDDYKGSEKYLAQDLSVIKEGSHIGDTYGTISDYLGSDKSASEFLHDLGYTGIKVHAAHNSNDARYKKNWNYVIFNDKDLKIRDKVKFFRTANGEAYGFTVGGKIYIDPRIATSETPIHEYAHLWAEALRKVNPKEWANVVKLMKGTWAWDYVRKQYPELETDDEIAEEALAHFSGKRGAERLRQAAREEADKTDGVIGKAGVWSVFSRIKEALEKFWQGVSDFLHIHFTNAEEVADKVMYDLLNKVNPKVHSQIVEERTKIERKAKEDGSWMKAPNGQESNLSEDQWVTVRTKQFKDWFGDWEEDPEESSQAVDENGEPKVFYHNTDNDFTVFDANRNGTHTDAGWLGDGFYFYGDENEGDGYGHKKMEVFLNVRNMYYATSTENAELADANDRDKSIAFRNEIEDEGYDGVYYNGDLRQEAVVFYPEQIKSATDNVGTYDAANPDIRYEKSDVDRGYSWNSVEAVNKRFNEELDAYVNQQMTKNDMLHLGMPSGVLTHFLPNLPIVMRQRILTKASVKKHNVDPLALKDMPKMMSHPIFIFQRADNSIGILTEMKDRDGKNVCVAIDLDREIQDGGETLEVNDVRSFHGREFKNIVEPIVNNNTLRWVDKKKGLTYLSSASQQVQQEIDKQILSSAAKIINGFENPVIKDENLSREGEDGSIKDAPTTAAEAEEADVLYREVDEEEAARLDSEPTVKVYRAMQEHDGKLYPPMSGRVKTQVETKKGTMRTKWVWRSPIEIGKWEQSEEYPEMANEDGTFTLDKGNGSTINAAYNPYIHTSRTPINDQFSSAWNRPELVTVEVEVPVSELTSGYHAEKAKDSTGEVEWKSGPVGREMAAQGNSRMVILSRWDKPVRIVPVEEVADEYAVRLAGTGIKVPFNTVPPALRDALVARGVEISEPEEGNAGKASRPSYEEWLRGDRYRDAEKEDITKGKFLFEGKPISELDGTEFGDLSKDLKEEVAKYFANEWKGAVKRPGFGDVILDKRSVKDDVSHGMNRQKAASFMAVPYIIRDGVVIDEQENWKGRNYDSVTIAAPITINKERCIGIAIVKRQPGSNRFYLYTVMLQKSLQDGMLRTGTEAASRQGDIAKILNNLYNAVKEDENLSRDGEGAYSDDALSEVHDPLAKLLGRSRRTRKERAAFASRERRNMEAAVKRLAKTLHLDNVNIVMDTSTLKGRKSRAKGFYDRNTNEITIVIPNHRDVEDVMQTLLHEGVAHYGLRKMFGSHFDTFLDNVYAAADNDVRRRITELALRKYGGDFRVATEEYLASLAEQTDFEHIAETFWQKIKDFFLDMLHAIGFADFADKYDFTLSDNELRYILWRSYENLKEPGRYRSILGEAEDIAKQAELKVGNYAEADAQRQRTQQSEGERAAEDNDDRSTVGLIKRLVSLSKTAKDKIYRLVLGSVSNRQISDLRNKGLNIDDSWRHSIENSRIIHAQRQHGIKDIEFEMIPDILENYDDVNVSDNLNKEGNKVLIYKKEYPNGTTYYLEEVRNGRKSLAFQTMYKEEKSGSSGGLMSTTSPKRSVTTPDNSTPSAAKVSNNSYTSANNSEKVSEPRVWGKKDLLSKAEQVTEGIEPDLLFRDTIEDNDNTARATYDMMANMKKNIIREAWQDSMINVRNLQEAVLKQRHETLMPYEDAYEEENRMHGKSKAEEEDFTRNYYDPLLDAVNAVAKEAKVSLGDVVQYMMAKHGLERNEVFANRDAQAAWEKYQDEHPKGKKTYDEFYNQYREKDYSGLTELTGTDNVHDAEAEAQKIVSAMESMADTNDLWAKTNAATKWTLKKAKDSGIVSKANYEQVRDMFDYYIPLRGWKDETADDIYDYVGIRNNGGDVFSPTLKKAHGRSTEADNPIAYIGSMAVSTIAQGNKNKVKQTFLGFVWNHPTNLVTVSDMWYRNFGTDTDPDWREEFPNIPEDATADEVAATVEQFEKDMETLASQGMATKKKGRLKISVPIKRSQALEHHVKVALNGREYVMYINGNPRAAQALNGTRARLAAENSHESAAIANVNRWLGQAYTSLSPAFTVSNLLRDYTMATALTFIKEGPDYARRFQGNMTLLGGPTRMFWLMHKYKSGKLDMNNETQRLFREFMAEGGETGFTSLKDIEKYKSEMQKKWNRMNRSDADPRELWHDFTEGVENVNRCIEDTVRFATYMTSRKGGKTVRESVTDAKNITLNFNRKGSGEMGNSTFRHLYIFTNPAIQGLNTVASAAKHHPVRFSLAAGFIAAMGMMQPLLIGVMGSLFGGGDDDDWNPEDEYWKLPAWQRRNNYVFWIPGTHKFVMIPLGQEFRMLHGFGETLYSYTHGHADDNPALELMSQAADLLPLDMTGNSGNPMVTLMPTLLQPIAQVAANTEFTGRPIYKDSEWNKYEPAWQKAYVGTPSFLVSMSKEINELTGGNDHRQGVLETFTAKDIHWLKWANNPAIVNHLMKGYIGGPYSFVTGLGGMAWKAVTNGEAPDVQEVPVVNRVITAPRETEQGGKQKLPDWYYDLSEENARQQNEFSGYKKDYMKGDADGQKKFNELIKGKGFQKWQKVNTYIGAVQQIRTAMNYTKDPNEKAELEKSLTEVLGELKKMKDE